MEKAKIYELGQEISELQGLNHKVASLGDFFLMMEQGDFPNLGDGFFTDAGEVIMKGSKRTLKFFDKIEFQAIVDREWMKEIQAKAQHYDALLEAGKIGKEDTYEYKVEMDRANVYRESARSLEAEAAKREAEATLKRG